MTRAHLSLGLSDWNSLESCLLASASSVICPLSWGGTYGMASEIWSSRELETAATLSSSLLDCAWMDSMISSNLCPELIRDAI